MIEIDLSNAPDGSECYALDQNGRPVFYKDIGDEGYMFWWPSLNAWRKNRGRPVFGPMNPVQWSGNGIPPIGLEVEAMIEGKPYWERVTLKYRSLDFSVFERADGNEFPLWNPQYCTFRRIRTPEQKAAEEREALEVEACHEIEELVASYNENITCSAAIRATVNAMINKGYRRTEVKP